MTLDIFDDIVTYAKTNTLKETAKLLDCSTRSIQRVCGNHNTFYGKLRPPRQKLSLKKKKTQTPHLSHSTANNPSQEGANLPGTPLKLTEEILETALVHALRDDPIKAIGPALQFLDKKKGLSIEGADTKQSLIAADKLKSIRKDMFS